MSEVRIKEIIKASIAVKEATLRDPAMIATVNQVVNQFVLALKAGKKILFCGNGGSASDAQHIAAELSGRFYLDRPALYAEALHVNTSFLTAVANDYGFDEVYARLLGAAGSPGDILVALSTSGNSKNIIRAIEVGKEKGMTVIGMTGLSGGKMNTLTDFILKIPSTDTPRIQEVHILLGHIICELVEAQMFPTA